MSNTTSTSSSGAGAASLLGIVFVTLKLCGVIDWSWWWVTCPFWIGAAIVLAICAVVGVCGLVAIIVAGIAAYFSK